MKCCCVLLFLLLVAVGIDGQGCISLNTYQNWIICESDNLDIECCAGGTIRIIDAMFGRFDPYTCNRDYVCSISCNASNSLSVMINKCENRTICAFQVNHHSATGFEDACSGTPKYLEVKFECKPAVTTTVSTTTTTSTTVTSTTSTTTTTTVITTSTTTSTTSTTTTTTTTVDPGWQEWSPWTQCLLKRVKRSKSNPFEVFKEQTINISCQLVFTEQEKEKMQELVEEVKQVEMSKIDMSTSSIIDTLHAKYESQIVASSYVTYIAYGAIGLFALMLLVPDLLSVYLLFKKRVGKRFNSNRIIPYESETMMLEEMKVDKKKSEKVIARDVDLRVFRYELDTLYGKL